MPENEVGSGWPTSVFNTTTPPGQRPAGHCRGVTWQAHLSCTRFEKRRRKHRTLRRSLEALPSAPSPHLWVLLFALAADVLRLRLQRVARPGRLRLLRLHASLSSARTFAPTAQHTYVRRRAKTLRALASIIFGSRGDTNEVGGCRLWYSVRYRIEIALSIAHPQKTTPKYSKVRVSRTGWRRFRRKVASS